MKRTGILLFSVFYLVSAAGIPLTIHYCHDRPETVRFFSTHAACGCCQTMDTGGCCRNVQMVLKADTDHHYVNTIYTLAFYPVVAVHEVYRADNREADGQKPVTGTGHDLPPPKPVPIWLYTCNLTYYS